MELNMQKSDIYQKDWVMPPQGYIIILQITTNRWKDLCNEDEE